MSDIETLLNQAWTNSFIAGPNSIMSALAGAENSSLSDFSYSSSEINICSDPVVDPNNPGPSPDGNAAVTLTNLTVSGLEGATNGGVPSYSNQDSAVAFTLDIPSFQVNGTCNAQQPCCGSWFLVWCASHFTNQESESFTATFTNSTITLSCSITQGAQVSVILQGVSVSLGTSSVTLNEGGPSWLQWLTDLLDITDVKGSLQSNVQGMLGTPPLMSQMQAAINSQLNPSGSGVTAVTQAKLTDLLMKAGLPANSRPTNLTSAKQQPDGSFIFSQSWRTTDRIARRRYLTTVNMKAVDQGEAPHFQAHVAPDDGTSAQR